MYIDLNKYKQRKSEYKAKRKQEKTNTRFHSKKSFKKYVTKYKPFKDYTDADYTVDNVYTCIREHNLWGALKIIRTLNLDLRDFGVVNFVNMYLYNGFLKPAFKLINSNDLSYNLINFKYYLFKGNREELLTFLPYHLTVNSYGFAVKKEVDEGRLTLIKHQLNHGCYKDAIYWIKRTNISPYMFKDHINEDITKYKEYDRAWMYIVELDLDQKQFEPIPTKRPEKLSKI